MLNNDEASDVNNPKKYMHAYEHSYSHLRVDPHFESDSELEDLEETD